ncbi:MAG: tetratricopeptide repeat protein, partial [Fibrobacter sp.]|nr:tetratricopeptide repeat protein [Fibrobacter sp.]
KIKEWSNAIITYQKLINMFKESKFAPNARFRTARCYETLAQWEQAAKTYLQLTIEHPNSNVASTSLFNAAVCFENAKMFTEAASTLKKFAQRYPNSNEAADALFKAGEIYGQLKDWTSVQNVNQMFMERFGNDKNRVVQALCMTGIALYMQGKEDEALKQLNKTVENYNKQEKDNTVNSYYTARALFTIGEIYTNKMNRIELSFQNHYRQQLAQKSSFLDKAIDAFTNVVTIGITEWTTRSIFQAGQSYEDFAIGIFKQKRDNNVQLDKRLALEFGITQAVDKYLISNALNYHERNVKFAIEKNIENQYILKSREKLTQLPYTAGQNYLTLAEIASHAENSKNLEGFALIANKLQFLQKIAPFQTRAIDLFLKCLELGTTYQEFNEFYKKTSQGITNVSLVIGNTYADVVEIARSAPVPQNFDNYEMLVYKTKLLTQIEGYENEAVTNYLKTIKISSAYDIKDENVLHAKENIAKILFNRARCYDLLCINVFNNPPFPLKISEDEKEEYKVQFEEIGLKFQEQAFSIYETILDYHKQDVTCGEYVTHSYVRLFQNYPEKYGKNITEITKKSIDPNSSWKFSTDSAALWYRTNFNDSSWRILERSKSHDSIKIAGFPDSIPAHLEFTNAINDTLTNNSKFIYLRQSFKIDNVIGNALFYLAADGVVELYFNDSLVSSDSLTVHKTQKYDFTNKLTLNKNVIAIKIAKDLKNNVYSFLEMETKTNELIPESPDKDANLTLKDVQIDIYKFPEIKNFSF